MTRNELVRNIYRKQSFLCVGLDTDPKKLPESVMGESDPVFAFNKAIVDATAAYCVAYKPNVAFYEADGPQGLQSLERTIDYIRGHYPDQLIIADAKRGDIGNTAALYARAFFDRMDVDALTVAPYMGRDSVTPFLGHAGKWAVVLALTSNPGSADFQMLRDEESGERLFETVLRKAQSWSEQPDEEMMFVVGATRGRLFEDVRRVAPRSFLLVPGVGAQGGSLEEVAKYGMIDEECGLLVNSSRGVIFASSGADYAEAAGAAAAELAAKMSGLLKR